MSTVECVMVQALKQRITVGSAGRIQIDHSDLPEGRTAEVTVLLDDTSTVPARPFSSFFGAFAGQFASPEEADAYLHNIR